jgi:hypothetical protein
VENPVTLLFGGSKQKGYSAELKFGLVICQANRPKPTPNDNSPNAPDKPDPATAFPKRPPILAANNKHITIRAGLLIFVSTFNLS